MRRWNRRSRRGEVIAGQVLFAEQLGDCIGLDCVVGPQGVPVQIVVLAPESGVLKAIAESLLARWCAEAGAIAIELDVMVNPPRAVLRKGDSRIVLEVLRAGAAWEEPDHGLFRSHPARRPPGT